MRRHAAPNPRTPPGIVTLDEVAALASLPQITRIMPVNGAEAGVRFGNLDHMSYIGGNDTNFPEIFNWPVVEGSYFTEADERNGAAVAVIGKKVRDKLLKDVSNPIGQYILIENVPFQVVGVLAGKGASSGDQDSDGAALVTQPALLVA